MLKTLYNELSKRSYASLGGQLWFLESYLHLSCIQKRDLLSTQWEINAVFYRSNYALHQNLVTQR